MLTGSFADATGFGKGGPKPNLILDFLTGEMDGKVSFTRADTSSCATYFGSDGLLRTNGINILKHSNFSSVQWVTTGTDGAVNTFYSSGGYQNSGYVQFRRTSAVGYCGTQRLSTDYTSTGTVTVSVYVRIPTGVTPCDLYFYSGTGTPQLSLIASAATLAAQPKDVWVRYSVSITFTVAPNANSFINTNSGTVGQGFDISAPQIETGTILSTYAPTTTANNSGPRFDFDPANILRQNLISYSEQLDNVAWTKTTSAVQTNLLLYSEQLDNAAWTLSNASVIPDQGISPDGTNTADKIIASASNTVFKELQQNANLIQGTTYTFSHYVKQAGYRYIQLVGNAAAFGTFYLNFDLQIGAEVAFSAGSSTVTNKGIIDVGNGWYRVYVSVQCILTSSGRMAVNIIPDATATRGVAWTSTGTDGILGWGAQLVQGSIPGDYRATTSSSLPTLHVDPFGSTTAQALVPTTVGTNQGMVGQGSIKPYTGSNSTWLFNSPITFSCYAKIPSGSTSTGVYLQIESQIDSVWAGATVNANLTNSTSAVSQYGGASPFTIQNKWSTLTSVGNGWYRVSITWIISGTTPPQNMSCSIWPYRPGDAANSSVALIWGAQLQQGRTTVDLYKSTTSSKYQECSPKGLLIESTRTNLIITSRDATLWGSDINTTKIRNEVGIDGVANTASLITETGAQSGQNINVGASSDIVANSTITVSAVLKRGNTDWIRVIVIDNSFTNYCAGWFNLLTGVKGSVSNIGTATGATSNMTSLGNGWYRCSVSGISSPTTVRPRIYINTATADGSGSRVAYGATYIVDCAQMEVGTFATSIIVTDASTVTRSYDSAFLNGTNFSSWYNSTQGTLMAEYSVTRRIQSGVVSINDGSLSNKFDIRPIEGSLSIGAINNISEWILGGAVASTTAPNKYALAYKINDIAGVLNAGTVTTDTSASIPTVVQMQLGGLDGVFGYPLNGHLRRVIYYPRRLLDNELKTITS